MKPVSINLDENNNRLLLTVITASYADSVDISLKAFSLADKMNHHPIVTTEYNRVIIEICTHDAGNSVTNLDRDYIQTLVTALTV